MKTRLLYIGNIIIIAALLISWPASAQAQTIPPGAKIGAIAGKTLEEQKAEEKEKFKAEEKKKPELVVEERAPVGAPSIAGEKILIKKFILNGVTKFEPDEFSPFLREYRNKQLGMDELNAITAGIQNAYRAKGYITTFVYIPDQKLKDNTIEIRVVEGSIGKISVEGTKYSNPEYLRKKYRVREGDMVKYEDLITSTKRLNRNPDRAVKSVLVKGDIPETTDIVLRTIDSQPKHLFYEFDTRGTRYTGVNRYTLGYSDNNVFGHDEMFSARGLASQSKLYGGSLDYNFPINSYDTRLGSYISAVYSELGKDFTPLEAKGRSLTGGVYLVHPLLDKEHWRVNAGMGFDYKNNRNWLLNTVSSTDDLAIVKFNFNLDQDDRFGGTFVGNEFDYGIKEALGSLGNDDTRASRIDASGDFFRYILQVRRQVNLPLESFLLLSTRMQYSPDKLINSEQFYLGGMDTVRGYPELEYLADYGYNVSAELRTPLYLLPKDMPLRQKLQMVYFVDYGQGFLRNPLVGEQGSESLLGVGTGFRLNLWKNFFVRLDWGFPLDPSTSDRSKNRVNVWAHLDFF